jgi:hypothetical protein
VDEKRWLLRKFVVSVEVDNEGGKVHCLLRRLSVVTGRLGEVYENLEKTKKAPGSQRTFRTTSVAGTGTMRYSQLSTDL